MASRVSGGDRKKEDIMEVLNRAAIKADARNFIGQNRRWLAMALACLPLFL